MVSRFTKRSIRGGLRGVIIEALLVAGFGLFAYAVAVAAINWI